MQQRPIPLIYNTLTGLKQPFRSRSNPFSWYICGPTVYDHAHLGHARTYVCFDIIQRIALNVFGLDSMLAMGITDVDDKIIARARAENRSPASIAEQYEQSFMSSMEALGVAAPDYILRVTEHIDEIVEFINQIRQRGFAYTNDHGDVVFNTKVFHSTPGCCYGKLQPANFGADQRQSDFALWKASNEPGASWDSVWGRGRPGWHIECSAMASSVFGPQLDVHGGGIDLKFPHHNNEIAQSEARFGAEWVQQWWHTGHLHIDGMKMSKSLKNFITVDSFLRDHSADQFRVFCLLHRYRSTVHYSADRMRDAGRVLRSFDEINRRLCSLLQSRQCTSFKPSPASLQLGQFVTATKSLVQDALADDFDTPSAVTGLLQLINKTHSYMDEVGDLGANRPLLANIRSLLQSQLSLFGINRDTGRAALQINRLEEPFQILVDFRGRIRKQALSIQQCDVSRPIADRFLSECDQVRRHLLDQAGVQITDHRDRPSSWSISSQSVL